MLPTPAPPGTRYRCGYPCCTKRYASTDGVRKHARKMHREWLREIDEQSQTRDAKVYGNKPSTYCIAESCNSSGDAECSPTLDELCVGTRCAQAVAAQLVHQVGLSQGLRVDSFGMLQDRKRPFDAMLEWPEAPVPERQTAPKTEHGWGSSSEWAPMGPAEVSPAAPLSALDVFCQDTAGRTHARGGEMCRAPSSEASSGLSLDVHDVGSTPRTAPMKGLEGGPISPFALDSPHVKASLLLPVAFEPRTESAENQASLERLVEEVAELDESSWYSQFVAEILA